MDKLFLVIAAHGLAKPDGLSLPDPFAVIVVDSVQAHKTRVINHTLHPYWNENFDVSVGSFGSVLSLVLIFYDQRPVW